MRPRQSVCLSIECLEQRCQPAGTVNVVQSGGIVRLVGDALDNGVTLTATGANSLTIAGDATSFISGPTSVSGVTRVYLDLGGGNDTVSVSASSPFAGQVIVLPSDGNDVSSIGAGQFDNSIVVLDDSGNDQVALANGTFNGSVILRTGGGDDTVTLFQSQFSRDFQLSTGRGQDLVQLLQSTFNGRVVLHTDDGNDQLDITNSAFAVFSLFDLGTGHDKANLNNVSFPSGKPVSVLIGGLGVDRVTLTGVTGTLIKLGFFP